MLITSKGIVMLVLSRKIGEKIRIGTDVLVTVVRIGPTTVRLGIEAPEDVEIVRTELEEQRGLCETAVSNR
ncbi:hypothetical protein BH11PLA2_BH11PLA2_34360 [soil metagenome]